MEYNYYIARSLTGELWVFDHCPTVRDENGEWKDAHIMAPVINQSKYRHLESYSLPVAIKLYCTKAQNKPKGETDMVCYVSPAYKSALIRVAELMEADIYNKRNVDENTRFVRYSIVLILKELGALDGEVARMFNYSQAREISLILDYGKRMMEREHKSKRLRETLKDVRLLFAQELKTIENEQQD